MLDKVQDTDCSNNHAVPFAKTDVSMRNMESLWVRLKAGDRIRPKDAQLLRRLAIQPFDNCGIYELNACGYVVAVGWPDSSQQLDAAALLRRFEIRYGIPVSYSNTI
jgi:hypothetical protein